jgi:hypothetical protein
MDKLLCEIENLIEKSKDISSKKRRDKVFLYSEGLKAKLEQVDYTLTYLEQFENRSDETESTTDENAFSINMQVHFYCDSFWTFLYSSLDVLSQVVNQTMKLELDEKNVSFLSVKGKLGGKQYNNTKVFKQYLATCNSYPYKNLEKYRNCSTHRRQIYIEEVLSSVKVKGTPGYSTTASGSNSLKRLLCDDPLTLKPKMTQNRQIPDYMNDTKIKIIKSILGIVKAIEIQK